MADDLKKFLYGTHRRSDQNITDALFAIADAVNRLANVDWHTDHPLMGETLGSISSGLEQIAQALDGKE